MAWRYVAGRTAVSHLVAARRSFAHLGCRRPYFRCLFLFLGASNRRRLLQHVGIAPGEMGDPVLVALKEISRFFWLGLNLSPSSLSHWAAHSFAPGSNTDRTKNREFPTFDRVAIGCFALQGVSSRSLEGSPGGGIQPDVSPSKNVYNHARLAVSTGSDNINQTTGKKGDRIHWVSFEPAGLEFARVNVGLSLAQV